VLAILMKVHLSLIKNDSSSLSCQFQCASCNNPESVSRHLACSCNNPEFDISPFGMLM